MKTKSKYYPYQRCKVCLEFFEDIETHMFKEHNQKPKKERKCFRTKEYSKTSSLCLDCIDYLKCGDANVKM